MKVLKNKIRIQAWLDGMNIKNYTINDDSTVNINGDLNLFGHELTNIPIHFKEITGTVDLGNNQLTELPLLPKEIKSLGVDANKLENLLGCPEIIHNHFDCSSNNLISLKGGPEKVYGSYEAHDNMIEFYQNVPKYIGGLLTLDLHDFTVLRNWQHCDFKNVRFKTEHLVAQWENFYTTYFTYDMTKEDYFLTMEKEFLDINVSYEKNKENNIEKIKKRKI
jgi:hypothetical protein